MSLVNADRHHSGPLLFRTRRDISLGFPGVCMNSSRVGSSMFPAFARYVQEKKACFVTQFKMKRDSLSAECGGDGAEEPAMLGGDASSPPCPNPQQVMRRWGALVS